MIDAKDSLFDLPKRSSSLLREQAELPVLVRRRDGQCQATDIMQQAREAKLFTIGIRLPALASEFAGQRSGAS